MKWLVRDCRELETVGIQGDETDVAGQRSLISWVNRRYGDWKLPFLDRGRSLADLNVSA